MENDKSFDRAAVNCVVQKFEVDVKSAFGVSALEITSSLNAHSTGEGFDVLSVAVKDQIVYEDGVPTFIKDL